QAEGRGQQGQKGGDDGTGGGGDPLADPGHRGGHPPQTPAAPAQPLPDPEHQEQPRAGTGPGDPTGHQQPGHLRDLQPAPGQPSASPNRPTHRTTRNGGITVTSGASTDRSTMISSTTTNSSDRFNTCPPVRPPCALLSTAVANAPAVCTDSPAGTGTAATAAR